MCKEVNSCMKSHLYKTALIILALPIFVSCKEEDADKNYQTFELNSPQLGITKTVWLYLPHDYHSSEKTYPVIYMQDAQWVFEKNVNYTQELRADETLRALEKEGFGGVIMVAVQSDENTRADEFSLYENPNLHAGGKGALYLDFLANTLKPRIDSLYRTKSDRLNTCIMGASLGGLATFYGLTEYPEVFGKAALFSAALHFNADTVFQRARNRQVLDTTRIFGVVGKGEFNDQVDFPRDNETLFQILSRYMPAENLLFEIHEDGEHKIWYWEREFPRAVLFLFN